ncbi:unnamed protein product [Chondrus crispus]|uniref:Mon2/Sec7/BIG1-like HUS domain-containing protein n=1 Tax=Chondrus crispus TaxID=2769 RepID=R7Q507_CHOCR|nr:unnamed protein product [Chondrus crispus]CDF33099.1 unnamed protein product [Chondrus crispus]|eukprot:XP_005712902.1 unnamed protein product [Chondrus crispus]
MCLAQTILGFSADAKSVRKTQGFLFNLLAVAVSTGDGVVLASNDSAEGLLEGLLKILEDFLEDSQCCELIASPSNNIDSLPFSPSHDDRTRQTIAQAYCALKVLSELAKNSANKGRMFLRRDVLKLLAQMLRCENLYHAFLTCTLETVWLGSSFLSAKNHGKTLQILTEGLLRILETSTSLNATSTDFENLSKGVSHPAPDFSISGKVLSILSTCSPEWGLPDMLVRRFLKDISRLLFLQHMVDVLESVAEICLNLATGFPKIAGTHEEFIPGVLQLLHSGKCLDLAVETLCHILPAHSLEAYRDEIRRLCERQLLSDTQVHSLSELLEDLISGPGSTRTLVHVSSCAENDDKETFVESNIGNDRKSKNGK